MLLRLAPGSFSLRPNTRLEAASSGVRQVEVGRDRVHARHASSLETTGTENLRIALHRYLRPRRALRFGYLSEFLQLSPPIDYREHDATDLTSDDRLFHLPQGQYAGSFSIIGHLYRSPDARFDKNRIHGVGQTNSCTGYVGLTMALRPSTSRRSECELH